MGAPIDPQEEVLHPNESWWRDHGGDNWVREIQVRTSHESHYRQQEAFLLGFFLGIPPARVLDFGCGHGRQLKNLRSIPQLELHGCDISPKMVEAAAAYLEDPVFASERIRLVKTRMPLPYPDGFFDIVLTSEVLIHVDTVDILAVVGELWRASSSLLLHIENRPVTASQRENSAHGGCWLHSYKALYEQIGPAEVITLPNVIEKQCVYLVIKPGSRIPVAHAQWAEAGLSETLERELSAERLTTQKLRASLSAREQEIEELHESFEELKSSAGMRLFEKANTFPLANRLMKGLAQTLLPPPSPTKSRSLPRRAQPSQDSPPTPTLQFAGIATEASKPTPWQFVEDQPKTISICHPDWRGIRAASYGQSEHVLEVPGVLSDDHCDRLLQFFEDCNVEKVVINGFPPRIDALSLSLAQQLPKIQQYFVYHGSPSQASFQEDQVVERILELTKLRVVRKVGFVKSGLAEFFRASGYPAETVMNICRLPFRPPQSVIGPDGKIHLGVFAPLIPHKNVEIQLIAALMVPGTIVHLCEEPQLAYLENFRRRIVNHGVLPRPAFLDLLGAMHASLYVSLVECYPMTVIESLACGTVCLTSHSSTLFNAKPALLEALIVREHDNPYAIARQLATVLENRENVVLAAQGYIAELNAVAEARWHQFLELQ
jgi:SAM-dependent methyltransferase/glycosyltransferase involved in cell wall biosynthesis